MQIKNHSSKFPEDYIFLFLGYDLPDNLDLSIFHKFCPYLIDYHIKLKLRNRRNQEILIAIFSSCHSQIVIWLSILKSKYEKIESKCWLWLFFNRKSKKLFSPEIFDPFLCSPAAPTCSFQNYSTFNFFYKNPFTIFLPLPPLKYCSVTRIPTDLSRTLWK